MTDSSLSDRALRCIPGGVNSPVRAFRSVQRPPLFAASGSGAYLTTTEGQRLIDFCLSFGPLLLGHADPDVVRAIQDAALRGTSYAVTTEAEIEMAELLTSAIPGMQKVRLVNSGTEAVMTALRLARGATGRPRVLKFAGCYHGHTDSMLVQAGSGVAGIASASSAGVTADCAADTLVAPFHDLAAVRALVDRHGHELAAIIVEPIPANMGLVLPDADFLPALRSEADRCGALLIFDEVITGFRLHFGTYGGPCTVQPDLTTLGKVIGGGLPIGAVGGRADLMDHLAPNGPVYQAGTLSGNPISVACGLATLRKLHATNPYSSIERNTRALTEGIRTLARETGRELAVPMIGTMFSVFFRSSEPRDFAEVMQSDAEAFRHLFHGLLERGVYLPPSPFETSFLSVHHNAAIVERVLEAWKAALR